MNGRSAQDASRHAGRIALGVALVIAVPVVGRAQSAVAALQIDPDAAVSLALANNLELESARQTPEIARYDIRAVEGAWAPTVSALIGQSRADNPAVGALDRTLGVLVDRERSSSVSLSQRLPWGASYQIGWDGLRRANDSVLNRFQPQLTSGLNATISQSLVRGFTFDAIRADRARSLQASERARFDFDGSVTALKREVLYAYWQWVYARELRTVAMDALTLARGLLEGNRARVAARAMAPTDVIEAEAEVARRDESVIVADKNVANAEDRLRLLILNPAAADYQRPLELTQSIAIETPVPATDPVSRALSERADLRVLRSVIQTDTLNVRQLRNDSRPDVSVTAGFSASAVGGSELLREAGIGTPVIGTQDRGFGVVLEDLARLRYPGWSVRMSVAYPLGESTAKATAARAHVERRRDQLALASAEQRVATEVRAAQREVETSAKRIASTETAVALAARRLDGEERKFLVGLSTSFFVFQAQRDLASARVARLGAVLDRQLSIADLEAVQSAPLTPVR